MVSSEQLLQGYGIEITSGRVAVVDALRCSRRRHLGAAELRDLIRGDGYAIGLSTVYRVLAKLEYAGLVRRHYFEGRGSVYEFGPGPEHDHMVCRDTGHIIEFQDDRIERLQREIAAQRGYELAGRSLVLYVRRK